MQVYWLEQAIADVRGGTDWLSPAEVAHLASLHVPKRNQDWRLGRWSAKHAVAAYLKLASDPSALAAIEVRPAESGAPEAFFRERRAPVSISLSHRDGHAACAVAQAGTRVGCDLEVVEPRCDAFVSDYFTTEEQQLISRATFGERFAILALLWSAKESVVKALQTGLRLDVRSVAVVIEDTRGQLTNQAHECDSPARTTTWQPFRAHHLDRIFHGWWQRSGMLVRTMVSVPVSDPPILAVANASSTSE